MANTNIPSAAYGAAFSCADSGNTGGGGGAEPATGSLAIGDSAYFFPPDGEVDQFTANDGTVWAKANTNPDSATYPNARQGFAGTETTEFNFSSYTTLPQWTVADETAVYVLDTGGTIHRIGYDGVRTHTVAAGSSYDLIACAGNYIYVAYDDVADPVCKRYNKADLTFDSNITLAVGNIQGFGGDATNLFVVQNGRVVDDTYLKVLNLDGTDDGSDAIALEFQESRFNDGQRTVSRMVNGNFAIMDEFQDSVGYLTPEGRWLTSHTPYGSSMTGFWQLADESIWTASTGENVYKIVFDKASTTSDPNRYWEGSGYYTRIA